MYETEGGLRLADFEEKDALIGLLYAIFGDEEKNGESKTVN